MVGFARLFARPLLTPLVAFFGLLGCSATTPPSRPVSVSPVTTPAVPLRPTPAATVRSEVPFPVMLGIDVLEERAFDALRGKRVGLLTHPAGVNRRGESTIDVLRRAPGVQLVALFGVEHGIYGQLPADRKYEDSVDPRTGLKVMSLYSGRTRKPTKAQLQGLDAVVVDLQDVGARSYTFISAMKLAMEACFEHRVELIVLDRPNPLGGVKIDGPSLDAQWMSYVGAFRVPYVHGLTMGELARMAKEAPGVLSVSDTVRAQGKLTVVPMRGWRRGMRWSETGLTWVATSPYVPDFSAAMGYAMTGLGCYLGGFTHGVGRHYPFRGLSHKTLKLDVIERELQALKLPGIGFRRVSVPDRNGNPATGLYVEVHDYDEWRPTELSFHLMRLACKLEPKNPFATATKEQQELFLKHMGSTAFFNELAVKGERTDVESWVKEWEAKAELHRQQSKRYWLYY